MSQSVVMNSPSYFKHSAVAAALMTLVACAQPITPGGGSGQPQGPQGPSIPMPIPGGGGSGESDSPSGLPPALPGPSAPSPSGGSESGEDGEQGESGSESGSGSEGGEAGKEGEGESSEGGEGEGEGAEGEAGAGDDDLPEGWEEETDGEEGEGGDSEITFEEPSDDDGSGSGDGFEQPQFEEQGGLSEAELEELERELDETLGDFDEEIEREKTYAEERANGNAGEDGLGGVVEFEEYDESRDGTAAQRGKPSPAASGGESGAQSGGADSSDGSGGASPQVAGEEREGNPGEGVDEESVDNRPDIEDLRRNDDIVARQMRELAESETDPVLKKQYWEEYYKYKGF